MIPRRYYIAPLSAFQSLAGVEWHAVSLGQLHLGQVDFGGDPAQQAAFEKLTGVLQIGTFFHQALPSVVATALQSQGVLPTDSVFSAIEKVVSKFGGIALHY